MPEKLRILVVDDDVTFAESLLDLLKEKGYDTVAVNSGNDAVIKVKESSFDAVIMDIKMPDMNGVDTYRIIKGIDCRIPVLMMTAFSVENLIKEALKEGAYGVMYKPLDINKLVKRIESACRLRCLIMIVDSDTNNRQFLRDILEEKGFVVTLAGSGEEAVNLVKERPEDIIFINMSLPGLNGLEAYLVIRQMQPTLVTVMISGGGQDLGDLAEQAKKEGVKFFLKKPFTQNDVVTIVETIIKLRR